MPTYALERGLPSYVVNRSFLKDAEFFIYKKAKDFLGLDYRANNYRIKIQDGLGTQTLASIDEFRYSQFPDDTIAMQLQYEGGSPEYSNIELRLASEPTLRSASSVNQQGNKRSACRRSSNKFSVLTKTSIIFGTLI